MQGCVPSAACAESRVTCIHRTMTRGQGPAGPHGRPSEQLELCSPGPLGSTLKGRSFLRCPLPPLWPSPRERVQGAGSPSATTPHWPGAGWEGRFSRERPAHTESTQQSVCSERLLQSLCTGERMLTHLRGSPVPLFQQYQGAKRFEAKWAEGSWFPQFSMSSRHSFAHRAR